MVREENCNQPQPAAQARGAGWGPRLASVSLERVDVAISVHSSSRRSRILRREHAVCLTRRRGAAKKKKRKKKRRGKALDHGRDFGHSPFASSREAHLFAHQGSSRPRPVNSGCPVKPEAALHSPFHGCNLKQHNHGRLEYPRRAEHFSQSQKLGGPGLRGGLVMVEFPSPDMMARPTSPSSLVPVSICHPSLRTAPVLSHFNLRKGRCPSLPGRPARFSRARLPLRWVCG